MLRGLRKSHTLQSCHFTGVQNFLSEQNEELMECMNMDMNTFEFAKLKPHGHHFIHSYETIDTNILTSKIIREKSKAKEKKKRIIGDPGFNAPSD